jgi:hypothetical protein
VTEKVGFVDQIVERIGRFEDSEDDGSHAWLGRGVGLALGVAMTTAAVATAPLTWVVACYTGSTILAKLAGGVWMLFAMCAMVYWRRQRIAMHFEGAHRRLGSADPDERQRGLVDLMVNARRGQAEHRRIARDLAGYLRGPPLADRDESGRRQLAFAMLADQTLTMGAKAGLDLSGASLSRIRGVRAELPGVRLVGADLSGAHLAGANLEGADLRHARLEGADLSGARLTGALLPSRPGDAQGSWSDSTSDA